jgi:hypothetical protein
VIDDKPIGAVLSRNLGSPTAPGEAVERELDAFISKRHKRRVQDEGERLALEMWQESERRYAERRREEMRAAWCEYHRDRAASIRRNLEALAEGHEAAAAKLMDMQPKGAS